MPFVSRMNTLPSLISFLAGILCSGFFPVEVYSASPNWVRDSSFEEKPGAWVLQHRPNMWKTGSAETNVLSRSERRSFDGIHSLKLQTPTSNRDEAVYAYQFLAPVPNASAKATGLLLSVRVRVPPGVNSAAVLLDIKYENGQYFFVELLLPPDDGSGGKATFRHYCTTITRHASIVSAMVTLSVQHTAVDSSVWMDDVHLGYVDDTSKGLCEKYTRSYPVERHVQPFFHGERHKMATDQVAITIATQLTLDRFENLKHLAAHWSGPISAAVLLFDKGNANDQLSRSEAEAKILYEIKSDVSLWQKVDVHIVHEDMKNGKDQLDYPVNFLRAVALRHVHTSHMYYLDADIMPSFNHTTTVRLLKQTASDQVVGRSLTKCSDCAFLTPLFIAKAAKALPLSKKDLVAGLKDSPPQYEPHMGVSHGVVQFGRWYDASTAYSVNYREDMEPYFIMPTPASPPINEMFSGYGRDKCAYSREAAVAGVKFFVAPSVFAVSFESRSPSIAGRSRSQLVRLRVFLNMAYHQHEMNVKYGGKAYPTAHLEAGRVYSVDDVQHLRNDSTAKQTKENPANKDKGTKEGKRKKRAGKAKRSKEGLPAAYGFKCSTETDEESFLLRDPPHPARPLLRKTTVVEGLLLELNTSVLVDFSKERNSMIWFVMMHIDGVVSVDPDESQHATWHQVSDLEFRVSGGSKKAAIQLVQQKLRGRFLFWLAGSSLSELRSLVKAVLSVAKDDDVIAIVDAESHHYQLFSLICDERSHWAAHRRGNAMVMMGGAAAMGTPYIPPLPEVMTAKEKPSCSFKRTDIDIILFTRNRPLQTLAFLESLSRMLSGHYTVWLFQRSDELIFTKGYSLVTKYAKKLGLHVKIIRQEPGQFGKLLLQHLQNTKARYTVLAVDEIIWIRPLNLDEVICYLQHAGDGVGTVQLRLGIDQGRTIPRLQSQSRHVESNKNMVVYYSFQLEYDWGYVLNVDGNLMRTEDILSDLASLLPQVTNPSSLENGWLYHRLPRRCRQWHIAFRDIHLVNNVLSDGRVLAQEMPSEASIFLARRLVEDGEKVNIDAFLSKYTNQIAATHTNLPVEFTTLNWKDTAMKEEL